MNHLFLIGYRGSGKSTVGKQLAKKVGWDFMDTDDLVERASGLTIKSIFETEGEESFRKLEQRAIASSAVRELPTVISLGGGAILRAANRENIQRSGKCVWLKGSAQSLYARIAKDATTAERRPNLSERGGYNEVVEVLAAREPIYQELAQFTIDTDSRQPDEIVSDIADWLKSND